MSHRQWLLCPLVAAGALALLAGVPSTRSEQGEPSRKAPAAEPITVFEGSSYAGDARVADLQPNEERLLSYAVDLGTEVKPEAAADSGRLTHLKAVKGVLYTTTKLRETKTFTVKDRNPQGRAVLIGHPVRDQFQRVDTTMLVQTARNACRFEVKVPVGKTVTLAVTEERDVGSAVLLTNSPDELREGHPTGQSARAARTS